MKAIITIAIAAISISVNAQSINSKASADSVLSSLNDKNYVEYRQSKDLYVDDIPYYVGNSTDAQHLYYAKNCGPYIGIAGTVRNFDSNTNPGVAVVGGWMGRQWMIELEGNWLANNYNRIDTDRYNEAFASFSFSGAIGKKIFDFNNHHDQIWAMVRYGLDLNFDHHSEVTVNGNISSFNDVTFKGFTSRFDVMIRYEHKFWGSPIHVFGQIGYGKGQKYTSDGTIWRGMMNAEVGLTYTLFRGSGWDKAALNKMSLTKKQARKLARTKSTIANYNY